MIIKCLYIILFFLPTMVYCSSNRKESAFKEGDLGLIPELGRSPGGGYGNPFQYSCLENPHGQRSLEGYCSWGRKGSDKTEWLEFPPTHGCMCPVFIRDPPSGCRPSRISGSLWLETGGLFAVWCDRVPDELWMEICDIVQETRIKTIPKKKKCKKAKWLSEQALQIAVKRKVKSKGEKERYTHLNAEFQRISGEIRKPSSEISAKE